MRPLRHGDVESGSESQGSCEHVSSASVALPADASTAEELLSTVPQFAVDAASFAYGDEAVVSFDGLAHHRQVYQRHCAWSADDAAAAAAAAAAPMAATAAPPVAAPAAPAPAAEADEVDEAEAADAAAAALARRCSAAFSIAGLTWRSHRV